MVQISKWQIVLVLVLLLSGLVFAAPNLLGRQTAENLPDWLPHKQISLGLDLRGGSYLLLEAQLDSVQQEHFDNLNDSLRRELRKAGLGYTDLRVESQGVAFTLRDPAARAQAREIIGTLTDEYEVVMSDDGAVQLVFTEQARVQLRNNVMDQTREILGIRIDETGVREPTIQRQGEDRILIQLPGVDDPERMKEILGKTAKLTFRFVAENVTPGIDPIPRGAELLPSSEEDAQGKPVGSYVVRKRVMVGGENLVDAQATYQDNQPVVSFRFDSVGGRRFARATQENVGRLFAIVLDGRVISAPQIREPILGGSGVITGRFTTQEVQDLALLLRAGALPTPLVILEERTVGPGLGADSIRAGEIASVLGLIFVAVFMALSYGLFGVIADIALLANLVLIAAALSGLQATLTLPGIAGIVLTIGMAVDANVLIFERIREEIRLGRGPVTAIDVGYRRAMTTIVDSNLTTLIAAVLLFFFGTGPVKGFAVTLTFGIISSLFTAIMVTRLIIVAWLRRRRPQTLPI
jgi:protein-export membrane protein SecD